MNDKLEENIDSIKTDIGCLTVIAFIFFMIWAVNSINHGNLNKLLAEQNAIIKQILTYQEQEK